MTHDELSAALVLQRKINRLQAQLDDIRQTGGIGAPGDNTPVMGGSGGVFPGQIAAELEQEIDKLKEQLRDEQAVIRRYLQKAELLEAEHKLMVLRYAECWAWDSVSAGIGYSPSRTYDYHASALEKIGVYRSSSDL